MRGFLLFCVSLSAFADPPATRSPDALRPGDRQILERTLLLTERLLRAQDEGAPTDRLAPLRPEQAAGLCGEAADAIVYLLRLQGVPDSEIRVAGSDDVHAHGYAHAFVVWKTRDASGEPTVVVLDPTFTQATNLAFDHDRFEYFESNRTSVSALRASAQGREILRSLREHSYWIPTAEGYQRFAEAIPHGQRPPSGASRPAPAVSWEAFRDLPAWTGSYGSAETFRWRLRQLRIDASIADLPAVVRRELESFGPSQVLERRAAGRQDGCFGALDDVAP